MTCCPGLTRYHQDMRPSQARSRERTKPGRGAWLFQPLNPSFGQTSFRTSLAEDIVLAVVSELDGFDSQNGAHDGSANGSQVAEWSTEDNHQTAEWTAPEQENNFNTFHPAFPFAGVWNDVPDDAPVEAPETVLQVFIEVFATTTTICTRGRSTRAHALGFVTGLQASLFPRASFLP
ncbi:unnamed protein product [Fusarium venenatum]|uniref:Uncharacterized protein n=1 Tax=Fusarium venenatum TaxID=56646 RepID=A0A2L2SN13_9HYPO|nr:uncharacterized protein FVRRES_11457 [Fusarium venenatum]CEI38766.1 unnamed protein product [Fusarium venenatum]